METVLSVATVKWALARSIDKGIKHGHRIEMNSLVLSGVEMSNRNIRLWNSTISNVVSIIFCSILYCSNFGPLRKFLFSRFGINKQLSDVAFSHRFERFRMWSKRRNRQQMGRPDNSGQVHYVSIIVSASNSRASVVQKCKWRSFYAPNRGYIEWRSKADHFPG